MVFLLVSCRPSEKTPTDTLVVGIEAAPTTLDPRLASDAYSAKISHLIHRGLFRINERLEIVPDLVESYEFLPPRKYIFRLRSGVTFHDGRPLTADDVAHTLRSMSEPQLASPFRGTMDKIDALVVLDPLTLEVTLKETFSPFLAALTVGIVPQEGSPLLGTGSFRWESQRPGEQVVLARYGTPPQNEWGKPPISRVIFRIVPDDNLRVLELKNHRIDVLQNNIPPLLLKNLQGQQDLTMETTAGINMTYLGFHLSQGPLSQVKVRQAMAHAIDRTAIIDFRMARLAHLATGLLSQAHWAYDGEVTTYPYDPEKAKKLLDEAGLVDPDGDGPLPRFSITYKTSTKKDRVGLARLIGRYLSDVGIAVKVLPYEWGTFFRDINTGQFDVFSLTWVGVTEPDIYHYAFHSSQQPPDGANRGKFKNAVVDRLTEEGRKVADTGMRKEIYSQVQKELARELPIVPLWYEDNFAIFSKRVKNVRLRPDASFDWMNEVYKE